MMAYTKEDIIRDTRPIFEELMKSKRIDLAILLNRYEDENPSSYAKIEFKVVFGDREKNA
jgi:hypothetical protein